MLIGSWYKQELVGGGEKRPGKGYEIVDNHPETLNEKLTGDLASYEEEWSLAYEERAIWSIKLESYRAKGGLQK